MGTSLVQQRHDPTFEATLLERVQKLSLDPRGSDGAGREYENEPVTTPERRPNLVVPHLRAPDVGAAVPDRNSMPAQDADQFLHELDVPA